MLLSMLFNNGGDEGPGECTELFPLALLDLHLCFRAFTLAR